MAKELVQNVKHDGTTAFIGDPVPSGVDLDKHPQLVAKPLTEDQELALMEEEAAVEARLATRKRVTEQREANKAAERKASAEADKANK